MQNCSSRFYPVTGVITDFYGPVSEDGEVAWDVEWFKIEIEKTDSTLAIIAGVHTTAFIFGSKPEIGMEITSFVPNYLPVFVNDPPLYTANAIIVGFSPEHLIIACCNLLCENITFAVNNMTEFVRPAEERMGSRVFPRWDDMPRNNDETSEFAHWLSSETLPAVIYVSIENDLPVAKTIFSFGKEQLFCIIENEMQGIGEEEMPQEIVPKFIDYIFTADSFETMDLPIFVEGKEINSAPLILVEGNILVPMSEVFNAGVGLGSPVFSLDENLHFVGCRTSSASSYWQLGRTTIGTIGSVFSGSNPVSIGLPPIIVGGIAYSLAFL